MTVPTRRWVPPGTDIQALPVFTPSLHWIKPGLRDLFDLRDPDIEYVIDAVRLMKQAGFDVEDPDVLALAIDAGHRRAERENDDLGLQVQLRRERAEAIAARNAEWSARREARACVYYARVGNRVKIGYSLDVKQRLIGINPEELLAVERGGPTREAERHQQFAALWVHGEWFRYASPLVEHVAALQV